MFQDPLVSVQFNASKQQSDVVQPQSNTVTFLRPCMKLFYCIHGFCIVLSFLYGTLTSVISLQVNLALYCHHCEQTTVALRLMYRVRYLISLMFGQDTPEIATCDVSTANN